MHRIYTFNRRRIEHSIDQGTEPDVPVHQRWSRTIGALGGLDVWRRLTELRVGIVGCGRSGSVAAAMLARLGIRRLVLIDPDKIEPHNLGEMDLVSAGDLGRAKAQAVASGLKRMLTGDEADVATIVASLTHSGSLQAARDCDVLFCCADDDAARLACALIATLDHKVLLDVGTGVRFENPERIAPSPSRVMGADVRLIVPGDGCLLCRGGLTRLARALDDLCYPIRPRPPSPDDEDWRRERAGSLTSLNHMAVAMGIQMLQDLVAERIRSSTWAQLEFDRGGRMAVGYPEAARAAGEMSCSLCAKAGLGDEGLRPER
jgi:molybdopterin/thiamine biosynthesis adenylyltransferase